MSTTISAPINSTTGFNISAPTSTPISLRSFWEANGGANLDVAVSLSTANTGRNLTFIGSFGSGPTARSVWRLQNGGLSTEATLTTYRSTSNTYFLPTGTITFVATPPVSGTRILTFTDSNQSITKSSNSSLVAGPNIALISPGDTFDLRGALGNDTLTGGNLNDTLTGGGGDDTLTGGADADTFVITNQGFDYITDFSAAAQDVIQLRGINNFDNLPVGQSADLVTLDAFDPLTNNAANVIVLFDDSFAFEDYFITLGPTNTRFAFDTVQGQLFYSSTGDWSLFNSSYFQLADVPNQGTLTGANFAFVA